MATEGAPLASLLEAYRPSSSVEAADVAILREAADHTDVWGRDAALHVTGSALVLDVAGGRVLLRWHPKLRRWLQVGGHADPGERDPHQIALREAQEETGLDDLVDVGGGAPVQVVIVDVPARPGEEAHRHADVRYLLSTAHPATAVAEDEHSPLWWATPAEARAAISEPNLEVLLEAAVDALRR